ncbi:hypothetical protein, partial [Trichloromonas sp.]|uniref:hypothetical protein n=1 Tax=Trichloromonas sp. TaxID=3069249 RepID=UPI002A3C212E|nr:hypothetical protein [Trichloromonas sp.]
YGDNMTFTTGFKVGDLHLDGTIFIVNGYVDGDGQTGSIVKNTTEYDTFTWREAHDTWPYDEDDINYWRLGSEDEMIELITLDISGQLNNGTYVNLSPEPMWTSEYLSSIRKTTTPPYYSINYTNTQSTTSRVRLVKSF